MNATMEPVYLRRVLDHFCAELFSVGHVAKSYLYIFTGFLTLATPFYSIWPPGF